MENKKIVDTKSKSINLEPDIYFFCACGHSSDGIYCDGSHEGTGIRPKKCRIDEPKNMSYCMCKMSKNFPYCDGEHRSLRKAS